MAKSLNNLSKRLSILQDKVPTPDRLKRQAVIILKTYIKMENTMWEGYKFKMTKEEKKQFIGDQIKMIKRQTENRV